MTSDAEGRESVDVPAEFGAEKKYQVTISQVIADRGAVGLMIPGFAETGPPDRLILDITRKPIINLVWLGTTLILLGAIVVFIRRRSELS